MFGVKVDEESFRGEDIRVIRGNEGISVADGGGPSKDLLVGQLSQSYRWKTGGNEGEEVSPRTVLPVTFRTHWRRRLRKNLWYVGPLEFSVSVFLEA